VAIVTTNHKGKVVLKDADKKTLAQFSGVKHDANPNAVSSFASAIGSISDGSVANVYHQAESELEDDGD